MSKVLKFGIISNSLVLPAWQEKCIREIKASGIAEFSLLILINQNNKVGNNKISLLASINNALFNIYKKAILHLFSKALRSVYLNNEEIGSSLQCELEKLSDGKHSFKQRDLASVRNHDLDFLVHFSPIDICGEVLTAPKYGVWAYKYYDCSMRRLTIPGYWEIYRQDTTTRIVLEEIQESDRECVILHESNFKTNLLSYRKNLDEVLLGSSDACLRVCKEILYGDIYAKKAICSVLDRDVKRNPTNVEFIVSLFNLTKNNLKHIWRKAFYLEKWSIGISMSRLDGMIKQNKLVDCAWLEISDKYQFVADPFCIKYNGKLVILFEDFDYIKSRNKAVISSIKLMASTTPSRINTSIIQQPVHLSYPFLIEKDSHIYCVPESNNANQVILFRAVQFPDVWEKDTVLLDGIPAVDSTVFEHNNCWWLFCTNREQGHNTKLFCWYSKDLSGPWLPHKLNPLKCDITSSRPAGKPFYIDGSLYRPSQDCSKNYGGAVTFNRITKLSPNDFREEYVSTLSPDENGLYPDGLHTICNSGEVTVVDGLKYQFYWNAGLVRIVQFIKSTYA